MSKACTMRVAALLAGAFVSVACGNSGGSGFTDSGTGSADATTLSDARKETGVTLHTGDVASQTLTIKPQNPSLMVTVPPVSAATKQFTALIGS